MSQKAVDSKDKQELDRLLEERWLSGLWNIKAEERPLDPKTSVRPHIWKWADVYDGLLQAADRIGIKSGGVERRNNGHPFRPERKRGLHQLGRGEDDHGGRGSNSNPPVDLA